MSIRDTSDWFLWDPPRELFTLPFIDRPVAWYGLYFALGVLVGYYAVLRIMKRFLDNETKAQELCDSLLVYIVVGAVAGARLAHVFFYSWPLYQNDLLRIFRVWEGGLASHGGAVGIFVALFLFLFRHKKNYPSLTFTVLLDSLVIPTAFAGGCIRIGNFFNQEILGTVTELPWAIVFGHPADGSFPQPRHPAQLYESFFYFAVFALLYKCWDKKRIEIGRGLYSGIFFVLVFGFRFLVENLKVVQSDLIEAEALLTMGQILSIPFIILGFAFLIRARKS